MTLQQAVGGGVAVIVGAYLFSSNGPISGRSRPPRTTFGITSVQDSRVYLTHIQFSNCSVSSFTGGAASGSLGSSSVYGGAFAIIQSPHVSEFREGVLSAPRPMNSTGMNLTVSILESQFIECTALTNSTSVRPGTANGGGGAVYASSAALSIMSVSECRFSGNSVHVVSGATGVPSNSSGGALAVEVPSSSHSSVNISSCSFLKCSAKGANIINVAVRGGAVAVSGAAVVSVIKSNFTNCSISDAGDLFNIKVRSVVVSGGAGLSVALARTTAVEWCEFDGAGSQDDSRTSLGILILSNRTSDTVQVANTSIKSSAVALSVQCISSEGFELVSGRCDGPALSFVDSRVQSLAADQSTLMTLQSRALFNRSFMDCDVRELAVFKSSGNSSRVDYSCRSCPMYFISTCATKVLLERLPTTPNVDRCVSSSESSKDPSRCPFGVPDCTTFVTVTRGFWTNFTTSGSLETVLRCPNGYCACTDESDGACNLTPLLSINRSSDPLCSGNRTGKLCGGCPSGFTQSLDDRSCISNEECLKNIWWVWTLSILGFAIYSLYIVVSCQKVSVGAFSCLVFYFQMSSFAADASDSDAVLAILEFSQVHSLVALYESACYAPSLSAYNATAFKLIGPILVLAFAVAWTWAIQKRTPWLQQRGFDMNVSYSGTLAVTILFVYSNVAIVVFTLLQCSSYSDSNAVVFIDGTVPCHDTTWNALVFVAVVMFMLPVAFAVALRNDRFPPSALDALCGKFTVHMKHWGALTLTFRLLIAFTQFLRVDYPNLLAFVRSVLSVGVLVMLLNLRPYVHVQTFWVDVACYVSLIAQFGLQSFGAHREFLGVTESMNQPRFFTIVSIFSIFFR